MSYIKTFILVIIVTMLLTTCKKYPEGGYEKRGPKNIIGNWKLALYEVNGIDSTDLINYNGSDNYKKVIFLKEQTKYNPHLYAHPTSAQENIVSFGDHNKVIYFKVNGNYQGSLRCGGNPIYCIKQFFNPEVGEEITWKILKLDKKEMIITSSQINSYKIKLTRK